MLLKHLVGELVPDLDCALEGGVASYHVRASFPGPVQNICLRNPARENLHGSFAVPVKVIEHFRDLCEVDEWNLAP